MFEHFPSSRMISTMVLSRDLSWLADPDFDPDDGDQYDEQLF